MSTRFTYRFKSEYWLNESFFQSVVDEESFRVPVSMTQEQQYHHIEEVYNNFPNDVGHCTLFGSQLPSSTKPFSTRRFWWNELLFLHFGF